MKELFNHLEKCETIQKHREAFRKILHDKVKIKAEIVKVHEKVKNDLGTETNKHVIEMYCEKVCHAFIHDMITKYFKILSLAKPGKYEHEYSNIFNILYEVTEL